MLSMLTVCLVLAVGGVRGEVLLRVVGVVRRLAVVVLVVVAASRTRRVLVGAGSPSLLAGITGHAHQTYRQKKKTQNITGEDNKQENNK